MELLNRITKILNELSLRMGSEIYSMRLYPDFSGDIGVETQTGFEKEVEFDNLDQLVIVIEKYERLMDLK